MHACTVDCWQYGGALSLLMPEPSLACPPLGCAVPAWPSACVLSCVFVADSSCPPCWALRTPCEPNELDGSHLDSVASRRSLFRSPNATPAPRIVVINSDISSKSSRPRCAADSTLSSCRIPAICPGEETPARVTAASIRPISASKAATRSAAAVVSLRPDAGGDSNRWIVGSSRSADLVAAAATPAMRYEQSSVRAMRRTPTVAAEIRIVLMRPVAICSL